MNKFQLLLVLILFSFTSMFSLKASSTLKNQAFLELQLSVVNHELCPSNGTIEFLAVSDDTSPITYSIYSSSDLINPIAITNQNELSGLIADSYTVIASQITDGETFTMSESIVVLNQLVVFDYSISVTNEYCNGDGSIAVNILSGSAVSYEITDGPEIRPIQTTPNFINLPAGIFTLEIINSCEEVCISQVTVQYFGNDISISNVVNNLTACDEIGVTIYIIRLDNANVIYPLEYTYIVHPPLTSGLPDDTLSYTMSTGGNPITTGHIQHAIPFYGANNIYTYDLTVMDGCGELFISPTATVNKALFYIMTPQYENCLDHFKMSFLQFQGPLYLELLEAPPGFDPSEYNDIYPGPYPDANYGHFNPVIFKNDTESAPPGLYKFKLTDACGTEFIGSKTLQPFGLKPYNPLRSTDCTPGFGNVYVYWQSDITGVSIVDAPAEYAETLPYDVSENIKTNDRVFMHSMPPGDYSFEATDICGNYSISNVTAIAYEDNGFEYEIIPQCGSFGIYLDHQDNYYCQHGALGNLKANYVLQKFYSSTNEWKNLNGTIHVPDFQAGGPNPFPIAQGAFQLLNEGITSNIEEFGHFRILRLVTRSTQDNEVKYDLCENVLAEFDYADDGIIFDDVYKFQCDDQTFDIACNASGVDPLIYRITTYEGDPFVIENGTNEVFTNLQPGLYNVQVEDPCGNIRNKLIDLTSVSFPNIFADLCDGEDGTLSIINLPFLSYEWVKSTEPNNILSSSAHLDFLNFNSSTDAGDYEVRFYFDSPDACIDQTLSYNIPVGSGPPNAGTDNLNEICNDEVLFDLTSSLASDADMNGLWFDELDNQVFVPEILDISNLANGFYLFKYQIEGVCSGSDFSEHTIEIITCNLPPVAICMDLVVDVNENCQAFLSPDMVDGGSSDPDMDVLDLSLDSLGPFDLGTHVVTLTVSDGEFSSSCVSTIIVQDTNVPSVSCQNIVISLDADGSYVLLEEEVDDGSADNCGEIFLQLSKDVFTCDNIGTQTAMLIAYDGSGNVDSCSFEILVEDNIPPDLICADLIIALDSTGNANISVEDLDLDIYDACGIASIDIDLDNFQCELGVYPVLVTVVDNNGNISTCPISVEVIGDDSDCDSIHDACDLCNGGDDTVDNNDDGLPDCAHPPAFADIIDDWKCGNNNSNVLVCHVPPGNPENAHTICISKDAVDVHVGNHGGDYLGECFYISCNQNKVVLENTELLIESVELFPNPASNYLNLMINETGVLENLQITDLNGRTKKLDGSTYTKGRNAIDITLLQKGIYFLSFELNKKIYVKRFIVIK